MALYGLEFSEKIGIVFGSFRPNDLEDSLADSVSYPMISHVDGFGSAELHCIGGYPHSCHVIGIYFGWLLRISEAREDGSLEIGILGVDVQGGILRFRGGAADGRNRTANWENGAVEDSRWVIAITTEVVTAGYRSCFLLGEMRSVGDNLEDHIAGCELNSVVTVD